PPFALQIRAMRAYHNLLVVEKGDNTQPSNAAYNLNSATAARALKTMESQTRRAPTPQGIANLSYVYAVGGDHTRAREVVDEALAKWPDDPSLLHAGFLAASRRGDHQQRVDYLERLRRLEPENAVLLANRVRREGSVAASIASELSADQITAKLEAATDQPRQGQLAEAEVLYVETLALEPQNFDALNRRGILKYQLG